MSFTLDGSTLPIPQPDAINIAFWEAAKLGQFVVARCDNCGNLMAAPVANCRRCLAVEISWIEASGRGTIYTFAEYHRAWTSDFVQSLPYIVAVVTLEEGPRMVLGVVAADPSAVRVGEAVDIVFQDRAEGFRVPMARTSSVQS